MFHSITLTNNHVQQQNYKKHDQPSKGSAYPEYVINEESSKQDAAGTDSV